MARYPSYEDYKDNPAKGIQRCDDLLKRSPKDAQLFITKLQLLAASNGAEEASKVLAQLLTIQPPIRDLNELSSIEEAVNELQFEFYPEPSTTGSDVSKLWENAFKSSTNINYKLDLQSLRFSRAVIDNRLVDAQQALIQMKVMQPKNRIFYMAHAAVTQLISTSKEDLQSRLALSLARKAVSERFDDDKGLDCRVPGQIFAVQGSVKDVEGIAGRPFEQSKQIHDFRKQENKSTSNDEEATIAVPDPSSASPKEWLLASIAQRKQQFKTLLKSEATAETLSSFATEAVQLYRTASQKPALKTFRPIVNAIFLAISALIQVWTLTDHPSSLLHSAYLAETLLLDQPDIYEAKVILIHLYVRLNLPSLAAKYWEQLSIKEIQHDTFGHAFLTRLSTSHPTPFPKTIKVKFHDPMDLLGHALNIYQRHENKLAETQASVLVHGQTGMLFDLHDLRHSLRTSLTRRILSLEQRRHARLFRYALDNGVVHITPRAVANWITVKDNRDLAAAFDFGLNVERLLHRHDEPQRWLLYSLAADTLWCLTTDYVPPVSNPEELCKQLDELQDPDLDKLSLTAKTSSLTPAEAQIGHLTHRLLKLVLAITRSGTEITEQDLASIDQTLSTLTLSSASSSPLPVHLQTAWLYLDALRCVYAFCKLVEKKQKQKQKLAVPTNMASLLQKCEEGFAQIRTFARDSEAACQTSKVKVLMTSSQQKQDETLVGLLLKDDNGEEVRRFCAGIAEAAKEAWGGFANGKVRLS